MQGKATVAEHPIHPMLIPFPIAFFVGSGIADIVHRSTGDRCWKQAAESLIDLGVIGGLAAAPLGLVDYLTIPMSGQPKRQATLHLLFNVGLVGLYTANRLLRRRQPEKPAAAGYALSVLGIAGLLYSGWLGGELVYRHFIGAREERDTRRSEQRRQEQRAQAA